jgi:hypothetical protein
MSYDGAGNLVSDGGQYGYDATGQQVSATYPPSWNGYTLQQSYDGDRLRGEKTDNGATTYYLRSSVCTKTRCQRSPTGAPVSFT